jgi:undecaprenyl-diphosphatase
VLVVVVACAIVTAALGVHYRNSTGAGALDTALDVRIRTRLAAHHHLLADLVKLGSPGYVIGFTAALTLLCVLRRRWRATVFAAAGIVAAAVLSELVLKPLVNRHVGEVYEFPSGHTTGAFAVAVTAAVLLLEGRGLRSPIRVLLALVSIVLAFGVGAAVIALGYHYTTDAFAGFCVALGVVLAVALLIDLAADRLPQFPAISRKRA